MHSGLRGLELLEVSTPTRRIKELAAAGLVSTCVQRIVSVSAAMLRGSEGWTALAPILIFTGRYRGMVENPTDSVRSFGSRLRDLRVARGLSQHQLAEIVGVSQRKLSDIERSKRPPLLLPTQLMAMAEALSVGVEQLAGVERNSTRPEILLVVEHATALLDHDILLLSQLAEHLADARRAGITDSAGRPAGGGSAGRPRTRGRLADLGSGSTVEYTAREPARE
jgi:transcriptional regulator with XRE-family HTH domain